MADSVKLVAQRVGTIAHNTFREAVRNRVLGVLVLFVVGLMGFSLVLGQLSLHEEVRIIKDLGLSAISLFGLIIALFLGVNLLSKELDRKTVYAIIPKPLNRWEFVLGKYLGLVFTMTAILVLMSVLLAGFVMFQGGHHGSLMLRAELLVLFELLLVVAVAIFFSSFSSPYLSAMFTGSVWIIGRSSMELEAFADKSLADNPLGMVLYAVVRVMPDFQKFYVSGANLGGDGIASIHDTFVSWSYVSTTIGYAVAYSVVLLLVSMVLFARRDLT